VVVVDIHPTVQQKQYKQQSTSYPPSSSSYAFNFSFLTITIIIIIVIRKLVVAVAEAVVVAAVLHRPVIGVVVVPLVLSLSTSVSIQLLLSGAVSEAGAAAKTTAFGWPSHQSLTPLLLEHSKIRPHQYCRLSFVMGRWSNHLHSMTPNAERPNADADDDDGDDDDYDQQHRSFFSSSPFKVSPQDYLRRSKRMQRPRSLRESMLSADCDKDDDDADDITNASSTTTTTGRIVTTTLPAVTSSSSALLLLSSSSPQLSIHQSKKRRRSPKSRTVATTTSTMTPQRASAQMSEYRYASTRNVVTPMECTSSSSLSGSMLPPDIDATTRNFSMIVNYEMDSDDGYHDLHIPPSELRPSRTLITGQCFNWRVVVPSFAAEDATPTASSTTTTETASAWGTHNATEWIGQLRVVPVDHSNHDATSVSSCINGAETLIVMIRETPTTTLYRAIYSSNRTLNVRNVLYAYFQITPNQLVEQQHDPILFPLEAVTSLSNQTTTNTSSKTNRPPICLTELYEEWSTQCDRMKIIASHLPGVRILDQDPFYCMTSFLCSSNNNIPRITKMLSSIQRTYGTRIGTIPQAALLCREDQQSDRKILRKVVIGWDEQDIDPITGDMIWYAFPSLQQLYGKTSESDLRNKCGMGYRAKYMMETIQLLHTLGGERYLHELRNNNTIADNPMHVQEQLLQFKGIGRKVADCIALFSLQQHHAIPVDVHVWNIARRDYHADDFLMTTSSSSSSSPTATNKQSTNTALKTKSLTPTIYRQIGDLFRNKFPSYSGWAHSLLFVAELPSFRLALPEDIVNDMNTVRSLKQHLCIF